MFNVSPSLKRNLISGFIFTTLIAGVLLATVTGGLLSISPNFYEKIRLNPESDTISTSWERLHHEAVNVAKEVRTDEFTDARKNVQPSIIVNGKSILYASETDVARLGSILDSAQLSHPCMLEVGFITNRQELSEHIYNRGPLTVSAALKIEEAIRGCAQLQKLEVVQRSALKQ